MARGLEQNMQTPPVRRIGDPMPEEKLSSDWMETIERFNQAECVTEIFGAGYQKVYAAVRLSEAQELNDCVTDVEHEVYLNQL
jgi:glutamine synthetase